MISLSDRVSVRPQRKRNTSVLNASGHSHIGLCPVFGNTIKFAFLTVSVIAFPSSSEVMASRSPQTTSVGAEMRVKCDSQPVCSASTVAAAKLLG